MIWFLRGRAVTFWEALLDEDVERVREGLKAEPSLSDAEPPRRISRREARVRPETRPLHLAAVQGNASIASVLIEYGADVDRAGPDGDAPLHEAADAGHAELVRLLVARDAAIDPRDQRGRTPLHRAALAGQQEVVDLLLDAGADIEAHDRDGNTPLHCLAAGGCERAVRRVLDEGAEVDVCNRKKQKTPLHLVAMRSGDPSAVNAAMPDRESVKRTMERIANLLLAHGADVNAVDSVGNTPLDLLSFMLSDAESDPLVRLLQQRGGQWAHYRHRHGGKGRSGAGAAEATEGETASPLVPEVPAGGGGVGGGAPSGRKGFRIGRGTVTIGRESDCDIRYRSRTLSRHHARIRYVRRGEYIIEDLDSHNGVLINDHRINAPHMLQPGEQITLGRYEFAFDGARLIPLTEELSEERLQAELDTGRV